MIQITDSPTLVRDEDHQTVGSEYQTGGYWTLTDARMLFHLLRAVHATRFAPSTALDVTATWDGGAILIEVEPRREFATFDHYPNVFAKHPLLGLRSTEGTLQVGRIVDSSLVSAIRPPHLEALSWIKAASGLSQDRIADLIGVSRQTLNRWEHGEPIKDANRQRVFAVREVLERAVTRHPTRERLLAWLDTPRGADARTPAQLLVAGEIGRARALAISTPSPKLSRAPAWVKRPVAPAFRRGAEHLQEALPPETQYEPADE
jgi:transcriptional regulator with XRE-family HTH domain